MQAVGAANNNEQQQQQQAQAQQQGQQQQQAGPAPQSEQEQVAGVQQRFLDRWLSVATVTLLEGAFLGGGAGEGGAWEQSGFWGAFYAVECAAFDQAPVLNPCSCMRDRPRRFTPRTEAIGVRHMAMLGRFRRRMAASGLSALINSSALAPGALDPKSVANLTTLMVKVSAGAHGRPRASTLFAPASHLG